MSDNINSAKEKLINDYINKIDIAVENYNSAIETDDEIFDLIIDYPMNILMSGIMTI